MLWTLRSTLLTQCVQRSVHRSGLLQHGARWSVVMNFYVQAGLPQAYGRVSKQAGAFRVHSTFCTCLCQSLVVNISWRITNFASNTAHVRPTAALWVVF